MWRSIETFTRFGDASYTYMCQSCTRLILSILSPMEVSVTPVDYLVDPEDIDDAEHAGYCHCHECDPDYHMDRMREERLIEEAS